ncbi:hypothetical protein K0M31_014715 [Melipona bicolor]|uniref:Uncharacterized protein n=1 Tax=Melipona bicolor TaxID=60889 RepID=A0AA40FH35_9HYME|nr:hypothetical protein K0M31_014715 [Melipona bicolor]
MTESPAERDAGIPAVSLDYLNVKRFPYGSYVFKQSFCIDEFDDIARRSLNEALHDTWENIFFPATSDVGLADVLIDESGVVLSPTNIIIVSSDGYKTSTAKRVDPSVLKDNRGIEIPNTWHGATSAACVASTKLHGELPARANDGYTFAKDDTES